MDWRTSRQVRAAARGAAIRAKGGRPPKVKSPGKFAAKGKTKMESVHVFAILSDGTLVLSRPDPTGTYQDGEHVHIEGIDFPEAYQLDDPEERKRRAKLLGLIGEWVVGHKVNLSAGHERDDMNRLTGTISWPRTVNPSGFEWAKGWSLVEILQNLNLDKYHPPVDTTKK